MGEQTNDIAQELAQLHKLQSGSEFAKMVERIARRSDFHPIEGETNIFSVGGEQSDDYANLLQAARKAVEHGYRVYLLPNPKNTRSADFILERKGMYRLFDLKTIYGQSSVKNRLMESIGQSNHVLLYMNVDYKARLLARDIIAYFNANPQAVEVMIFKKGKLMSVTRKSISGAAFVKSFIQSYYR